MKVFKLGLWFLITLTSLYFFSELSGNNREPVSVSIFNYTTPDYEKWRVLVAAFFAGAIFSTLFFIVQLVILETKFLRLKRAHKKLERSIQSFVKPGNNSEPSISSPNTSPMRAIETEDV